MADVCFWKLDAPIRRVSPEALPAPYSAEAEEEWLLDVDCIRTSIAELAR